MIITLYIIGYVAMGIPTGVYSRIRSYNKSFNRWHAMQSGYYASEYAILQTHKDVNRYDQPEIAMSALLGTIFWPLFLIGFGCHFCYKKIENVMVRHMPRSSMERIVYNIQQNIKMKEELEARQEELIKVIRAGRKAGLDVSALENSMKILNKAR